MRLLLLTSFCICVLDATVASGQESNARPVNAELAKQRADATLQLGQEHAANYTIYRADSRDSEFKLHPAAVFRFTNPVPQHSDARPQEIYGGVFLWTDDGLPEAVVAILKVFSPGTPFILHELTSLSDDRVVAEFNGTRQWYPKRPGINRKAIPGAARPAETAGGRLTQMRLMSRQFAANKTDRNKRTTRLRLLSKPLYRYDSGSPAVIDGALFAFADGTDPEVLLLLEARRRKDDEQWYFATARLNQIQINVLHQKQPVWQAPSLTIDQWRNRQATYSLLRQPARESKE